MSTEWVAYTAMEGRWAFTRSASPLAAIQKLEHAIFTRRVLRWPVNNPITAIFAGAEADQ